MAEGITVKEALDLIVLNGIKVGRVIAGFGGLDNIITSVSVIEVPDATRWYRGNELQITAFYSIKDDVKAQVRVIERIAQCNCSALVLCHTGIFLKEVSQELIDAANYYKLPLILVPAELAYIDIITPVLEAIIDKQKREIEYAFNVQRKMNQIILQGNNIQVLAGSIAKILKCPLLVIDGNNAVLASGCYNSQGDALLKKVLGDQELCKLLFAADEAMKTLPGTARYSVDIRKLTSAGKYLGKLVLFLDHALSTMENVAVNEACQALKLVLMQEMAKEEEKEKARREFIDELLYGSTPKREDLVLSRAENLNIKVPAPPVVMIIEFESYESLCIKDNRDKGAWDNAVNSFRDKSINIVKAVMVDEKSDCIVVPRGNHVIAIFSVDKEQSDHVKSVKKIGRRIEEILRKDGIVDFVIAFGNQYPLITDIHKSYVEALKTINIARVVFNQTRCVHVTDLGIYYYLPELLTDNGINEYIDSVLSVIEKYDREKEADLLETFKLLLFEDNIVNIADKLYVHRNTLLNRKKKIRQLLGEDPFSHPLKLNYQLVMLFAQLRKNWT